MKEQGYLSFDSQKFLSTFHGMEDLGREAVENFLDILPAMMAPLEEAVLKRSPSDLELSAHTLKGALSNFYAEPSRQLAWRLEQLGHEGIIRTAEILLESLKVEVAKLSFELQVFLSQRKST